MTLTAAAEKGNVVQFKRGLSIVDQELATYLKELNGAMQERAGVSYIAIRSSLHGSDLDAVKRFLDEGVSPQDAAKQVMDDHGLRAIGGNVVREVAGAYNRVQAAISEFVAENADWHRTDDGRVYSAIDDTVAFLQPVRYRKDSPNEPEAFGFGIELRDGAEIDFREGTVTNEGTVAERFAGWDLAQPLEQMHTHVASREKSRDFSF